jgi:AcrR family transcriptional regulator
MKKKRKRGSSVPAESLVAADWLRAAREDLIRHGILAVKVDRLARRLGVTRGSFYWHFKSHGDLLTQLLDSWAANNTAAFRRVLESDKDGYGKFDAIVDLWLAEEEYDPRFDTAVREWARVSSSVARVVRKADEERIGVFRSIFLEIGYRDPEALVRARITYFHQVGYYTLGIAESPAQRRELRPCYTRALLGRE